MQRKWLLMALVFFSVLGIGLFVGKVKDSDRIIKMYERQNFTLLDDSGGFFRLSDFPKEKKLLLIFTPDGILPPDVVPFFQFSKFLPRLQKEKIDVALITRTNKEIVKNFKQAAKFPERILLDESGTVGKLIGVWPDPTPVDYWSYALTDANFKLYWLTTTKQILGVDEILSHNR